MISHKIIRLLGDYTPIIVNPEGKVNFGKDAKNKADEESSALFF